MAQAPTDTEQHQTARGNPTQAQGQRDHAVLGGIFEQEGDPQEQDQDAHPHHQVAVGEEAAHRRERHIQGRPGWRRAPAGCRLWDGSLRLQSSIGKVQVG